MWRDAILHHFLPIHTRNDLLTQPLGSWYSVPRGWQWFSDPLSNSVFHCPKEGPISLFCQQPRTHNTRMPTYRLSQDHAYTTQQSIPITALPTTIRGNAQVVVHTGTCTVLPKSVESRTHPWSGLCITPPLDMAALITGIQQGTAIAVTDGSFKNQLGTAGFTIQPNLTDDTAQDSFIMVNQTPGDPMDMDAYRAELGGIFGIIDLANHLCTSFSLTSGHITVGCDCSSALTNITSKYPPGPQRPHHDLLSGIRYLLKISPLTWTFHHVRGHQDDHIEYHMLDRWARLNVDMDQLAKLYWDTLVATNPPVQPFHLEPPLGQWTIWHDTYRLPCWTTSRAQRIYYRKPTVKYWSKRLHCADPLQDLDWPSTALALRRTATHQRLWVPKWLCSTLPIGKNLVRWGQPAILLACPRCGEEENHRFHVMRCLHPEATAIRETHLENLYKFLDTTTTEPGIKLGIVSLLTATISDTPWIIPEILSDPARNAANSQLHVGVHSVLDGFLSPIWAQAQQLHYESLGRRSTGTQWMSQIIRQIWQIAWDLWVHRRSILESTEAHTLPAIHMALNDSIDAAYHLYRSHPSPAPSLARWFARPPSLLHHESIDWKTRWLEMVDAIPP